MQDQKSAARVSKRQIFSAEQNRPKQGAIRYIHRADYKEVVRHVELLVAATTIKRSDGIVDAPFVGFQQHQQLPKYLGYVGTVDFID